MNRGSTLTAALTAALALFGSIATPASLAAPHAPSVAPLCVQVAETAAGTNQIVCSGKKGFAKVAAAAVCTEDLATISFQEYSVDWSSWVQKIADNWSNTMNATAKRGNLRPSGPMFIEFTVKRDGTIGEVFVDRSSGDRVCDALQIGTLLHCTPLPKFPTQSRKKSITLLCIWSYANQNSIAKSQRHQQQRPIIRVSISGAQM